MITAASLPEAIELAGRGQQSMVKCPGHDDGQASLHVSPGTSQPVLLHCHAGCETGSVLAAAGVDMKAILAESERDYTPVSRDYVPASNNDPNMQTPAGPASHRYLYTDEEGQPLFEVLRIPQGRKKTFRQRHLVNGRWVWNMQGVRRVLYYLPEVIKARDDGRRIWLVEGEKDVETVRRFGEVATTAPMGAGKWLPEYTQMLAGATITIIADMDGPGRAHARLVREELAEAGCNVTVMEPPPDGEKIKDVTDHVNAGGTLADLLETSPEGAEMKPSYGIDVLDAIEREFPDDIMVIPDVIARGERMLVTGLEGQGKSQLMRQLAVQCAAGIHPWTGAKFEPQKVLFIDGENRPQQVNKSWQQLLGLAAYHGSPVQRERLQLLEEWKSNVDLSREPGYYWLMERIYAYRPDIVFVGPLYHMVGRDLKEEEPVRRLASAVNDAITICDSAFVMEHHAPLKEPGAASRSVRPYGSSMFLKWPDYGFGLKPTSDDGGDEDTYQWQRTRWPRVRERIFPTHMRWGKPNTAEWPWMAALMDDDGVFHNM